jgi:glycosyltransferase involved in cell wall biosynthesis
MRICLLTGGGYPFRRDALGGWCRTLVDGLDRHTFELLSITDREPPGGPVYPLPAHVASAKAVSPARRQRRSGHSDSHATAAAGLLCRGLLAEPEPEPAGELFTKGLFGLSVLAHDDHPLSTVPLTELLLDSWRAGQVSDRTPPLPRLSLRDARTAATLLRHATRALGVPVPAVDLVHCVGGTTPLLAALAGRWRTGTPLLLTEARTAVSRPRAGEERLSPAVLTVLRRFRRCVARTGYAEAGLIAPLSAYHHGWARGHGAEPGRLVPVPAGVDPAEFPSAPESGAQPALGWAGNGGPDSGLRPLLDAFAIVLAAVPGTVLHLVGVAAAHEEYCAQQVQRAGLGRAVRLHPLPASPRDRYADSHLVVHVPGPADPPYQLVEAMMSGRAVVGADVGEVAETLGDAGVVVAADDPAALAAACVALLRSPTRRRALGEAARRRALACFTAERVVRVYGALYTDLAGPPPPPAYELTLAVPAPRTGRPATLRWLAQAGEGPVTGPLTAETNAADTRRTW